MRRLALSAAIAISAAEAQRPFDVLDYDLTLTLPEVGRTISGRAVLTVLRRGAADSLALDLRDLRVERAFLMGKQVGFVQDTAQVRVFVGGVPGDTFRVAIEYAGAVRDGLIISTDGGRWTAFGDNWPNRARRWIPSVDHPSDKATVSWTVIAPSDRKVVANGVLVEEAAVPQPGDPDGHAGSPIPLTRTRWRESRPISTYLMVIAAAPLVRHDLGATACGFADGGGCVPQQVYTAPEVALPASFREADSIVTFFSRTVGAFPYEKLAHLQSNTRFGGMENASAIFYSDRAFRSGDVGYSLIAHETAHQWFGDAVTERDWSHLWLSEGFATYLAALYTRHSRGGAMFREEMSRIRAQVLRAPEVASRPVIDSIETDLMALLNANSYQKGGFVLHMLREEVGDSVFVRGLRVYLDRHRHGTATTDDLRAAVEIASGRDLRAFFDQWLRRPGFPEIETAWRLDAPTGRLSLTVTQAEQFGFFMFPLTVEFTDAGGATHRARLVVPAQRESVFTLNIAPRGTALAMRVDPDVALLARIRER